LYPVSYFEYYPPRQNVHDRHRRNFSDKSIFLPPTIPSDIISRIPAPENWSIEDGAQESCQSPIRWTYPVEDIASEETNTVTGEIPVPPSDECVRRIKFPWQGRGEDHYTIRVSHRYQVTCLDGSGVMLLERDWCSNIIITCLKGETLR